MFKIYVPTTHRSPASRRRLLLAGIAHLVILGLSLPPSATAQSDPQNPLAIEQPGWAEKPAPPILIEKRLIDLPPRPPADTTHVKARTINPLRTTEPLIRPPEPPPELDPLLTPPPEGGEKVDTRFITPRFIASGQSYTGTYPPDTMGEVGTTHFIQTVNSPSGALLRVHAKTDGRLVGGPFNMTQLAPAGDLCATSTGGDGVVVFDQLARRWLLLEFVERNSGNRLCIYLSTGENPLTSNWRFYGFNTPIFPDYPKVGVWPDGYYIATNEQNPQAGAMPSGYILDRGRMLAGQATNILSFSVAPLAAFGFQTLTPADLDGANPPPPDSPGIFMRHRDDEVHNPPGTPVDFLEIWEAHVDFQNPANSFIVGPINIRVAGFNSHLCRLGGASDSCVPQAGTSQGLDTLKQIIMWRLSYRNFESHESLLGNYTVDINGADVAGIRWFELRRSPPGAGSWRVHQAGTLGSSTVHRWMGSIAMDRAGNIALGYSRSSGSILPQIAYIGREASGPLGQMTEPEVIFSQSDFPQIGVSRWGDYASLTVDPSDDLTFWFTSERMFFDPSAARGRWTTRITSFAFDPTIFVDGFETRNTRGWDATVKSSQAGDSAPLILGKPFE